jgi:citrate lyase synthetase
MKFIISGLTFTDRFSKSELHVGFEDIARKKADEEAGGASRAPALLDAGSFDDVAARLARLAPKTTLEYLDRRAKRQTKA